MTMGPVTFTKALTRQEAISLLDQWRYAENTHERQGENADKTVRDKADYALTMILTRMGVK